MEYVTCDTACVLPLLWEGGGKSVSLRAAAAAAVINIAFGAQAASRTDLTAAKTRSTFAVSWPSPAASPPLPSASLTPKAAHELPSRRRPCRAKRRPQAAWCVTARERAPARA